MNDKFEAGHPIQKQEIQTCSQQIPEEKSSEPREAVASIFNDQLSGTPVDREGVPYTIRQTAAGPENVFRVDEGWLFYRPREGAIG